MNKNIYDEYMFQEIIVGITVLANLFIGFIVYKRNNKSATNILLSILSVILALWTLFNFLALASEIEIIKLFWVRVVMLVTTPFGPLIYLLAASFPKKKLNVNIRVFQGMIVLSIVSGILAMSPFMFMDLINLSDGGFTLVPGPAIAVFGINFLVFITWGFIKLVRNYKKSYGVLRKQFGLFLFGTILSFSLMTLTNFVAVVVFHSIELTFLGPPSTLIMVGFISYAIIKHKFLDIRLIIARSLSYSLLLVILSLVYAGGVVLIGGLLFDQPHNLRINIIIQTVLALIIALTYTPLKRGLERLTDRVFFQYLPNPDKFLKEIGKITSKTLNLELLAKNVTDKIVNDFRLEKGVLFGINGNLEILYKKGGMQNFKNKELFMWLDSVRKPLILIDEISNTSIRNYLDEGDFSLILRFGLKDKAYGYLFLGDKKSGIGFFDKELSLLEIVRPTISVALNNALQYQKIQKFADTLKTKVKEATGKLTITNKKLKELDKRKDEFISVAAHELRAPLTAVKGYLSMIMEGDAGKISKQAKEFIEGAIIGADREIRLVNDMLNVSRIEENRLVYEMGKVKLSKVVEEVFNEFKLDAKTKGLKFDLKIEKNIKDKVYVDIDRIHEVVANYVSNAIKYTDEGLVNLVLRNTDDNKIRFEVEDTGNGMRKEEQKKLFNKFYRAASSSGKVLGTGLGLYIVKLLVEKFGGKVGLESEIGKGSKFWFEIPCK